MNEPMTQRRTWPNSCSRGLTGIGVTVLSTMELPETFTDFRFSPHAISFLTDDILRMRYVEIEGELRTILVIVKMRGGKHSKQIREYEITSKGVVIGKHLKGYQDLITGGPQRSNSAALEPDTPPAPCISRRN